MIGQAEAAGGALADGRRRVLGRRVMGLLRGSGFIALTRIGGAGLGFVTQVVLAHLLGPHDLGLFYSATSLAAVAGFVTVQGYSQIAARFAARYRADGKAGLFGAFVTRASLDSLWGALAAALVIVGASFLGPDLEPTARLSYAIGGVAVLATACLTLYTNLAGAMRLFGLCYLPEGLVRPAIFLILVSGLALVAQPTGAEVTALYAALTGILAVVVFRAMRRKLPPFARPGRASRRLAGRWRREAWPLVLLSLYTNSFADIGILFATPFMPSADVAVFGIALKLALLVGYVVQIAQQMAVPDLADGRRSGDHGLMSAALQRSVAMPVFVTAGATVVCLLFGDRVLAFFGPHFAHGRDVLAVLVASQLVRAIAGPSAHLLTLTGAQGLNARLCAASLAILFVSNCVLTRAFGPLGAAGSVLLSYGFWLAATAIVLRRMGEIRTDMFASFREARRSAPA